MPDTIATLAPDGGVLLSPLASSLLTESHAVAARAYLIGPAGGTLDLPLLSGSVACDSSSAIRRTADISVYATWSESTTSVLTPYGSRVRVERGIRTGPGSVEWVPLITGRVTDVKTSSGDKDSALGLSIKDDMFAIKQDRFDTSRSTVTTETVVAAIKRLINETLPAATVTDFTGSTVNCAVIDLQQDRADAITTLATSIGAECFALRDGSGFVIRPAATLNDSPRWTIGVGDYGNLIAVDRSRKAEGTYNRVFAYGESNDTSENAKPPVSGSAQITDITDPLYYGGPFGKVTRFYKSALLTTTAQATTAAAAMLEKARGRNYEISFTTLVNPAVEPNDVMVSILTDGRRRTHIVDSVSLPLAPSDSQSISVRTIDLPSES